MNDILKVSTGEMHDELVRRDKAWEARLQWFAERGLKPRLLDTNDLAAEAAGLPYDQWPNSPQRVIRAVEVQVLAPIHASPTPTPKRPPGAPQIDEPTLPQTPATAKSAGFTGSSCAHCGSFAMVRSGTCETCQKCGVPSGGCS